MLRLVLLAVLVLGALTACRAPTEPADPPTGSAAQTPRAQGTSGERRTPWPPGSASPSGPAQLDPETGLPWVAPADLPAEARSTIDLIERGGPYPYRQDGQVFNNFEQILPSQARGFYHEYTVPTPGEDDRGARRIVTGDGTNQMFYTDDHYDSFARIRR